MNSNQALVLFTGSYPYYSQDSLTEQSFLQIEVQYLAEAFQPLIIAPNYQFNHKSSLPDGVKVDLSYSRFVREAQTKSRILHILKHPLFFQEVLSHPRLWLKPEVIRGLARRALHVLATRDWVIELFQKYGLDPENTIFYTYWLNNITLGVGMAKQKFPAICLASRAHGGDLYHDRRPFSYFSYRSQTLRLLDRLFLISEHGRIYITDVYPRMTPICEVSRLGVRDFGFINPGSKDGVFRIVSCSSLTLVKRVDLLLLGIAQSALDRPGQLFEWNHFGDGPMADDILLLAERSMPSNISWHFHGSLPNAQIIRFYRENPIDLFGNVSSSEGIPVSIMEAACFGIPLMATAVGGTPEIVSEQNGKLLSSNPFPKEIAKDILDLLDHPQLRMQAGNSSRRTWQLGYDADRNYSEFVNRLIIARVGNAQ